MKKSIKLIAGLGLTLAITSCGSKENTEKELNLKPGTYSAITETINPYNGFKDEVTLVVDEDGKMTDIVFDGLDIDGESKRDAVKAGNYDMTVDGSEKDWIIQVGLLGAYIEENQTTDIKVDDQGKTDAVAGVTITVKEHLDILNKALESAK